MKSTLSIVLLSLGLVSCATSPTLEYDTRDFLDLSGQWNSTLGDCKLPGTTDENKLGTGEHPTTMTTALTRLYPYEGAVTYSRTVNIPESMMGKRLELIMERTKSSTLWIDGDSIGSFDHLYAPHKYVLPEITAGQHEIAIRIDNSENTVPAAGIRGSHAWTDATQTNWNGILGKFGIEATPKAFYIENVQVFPDIDKKVAKVEVSVEATEDFDATFVLKGLSWNSPEPVQAISLLPDSQPLTAGTNVLMFTVDMGENPLLWSEFHPALYNLVVEVESASGDKDTYATSFGMRKFATEPYIATQDNGEFVHVGDTIGSLFTINGLRTFLRGKHDGCVFPLTGYAPMDVESWQKVFKVAKAYGINHYRCHSYTPPRAALLAADIEGIYFDIELPYWGFMSPEQEELNAFMLREGHMMLDYMGNSPSFMILGLGNELSGQYDEMRAMVNELKAHETRNAMFDSRHLYSFGANDNLGWQGPQEGEDCFITCRVGGYAPNAPVPDKFSSHVRSSFSFADADDGGIINGIRPNTAINYTHAVRLSPTPVVSHETCQFQIYPDYNEIQKYTGVLYPYNYEVFRSRLDENGLTDQAQAFHQATGEWSMDCYKADIEYVLRTPGMAGYEMLDLQDYPGQGSALCGVLDAFMETKGIITEEEFRQFCAPVVPLALMDSLCFWSGDPINIGIALSNFLETSYENTVEWTVSGDGIALNGVIAAQPIKNGEVRTVGCIDLQKDLASLEAPRQLTLSLKSGEYSNTYRFWVYTKAQTEAKVLIANKFNADVKKALENGEKVVLIPEHKDIEAQSIEGMLTPDYWNYAMFKTISENNKRPVSPGSLGLIFDENNPFFAGFPSLGRSDWQWWSIVRNSRPLILNTLPKEYRPMVQVVDNIERNHKLGLLIDLKVGNGSLLICQTNLDAIASTPEGASYRNAVLNYAASDSFAPTTGVTAADVETLLNASASARDIQGVKNISDYIQQ